MNQFKQYHSYFRKVIFGVLPFKYDNNELLTDSEITLGRKLHLFRKRTSLLLIFIGWIVMLKKVSNIWIGVFILVTYYIIMLILFYILFSKEDISIELIYKLKGEKV